MTEYYTHKKTGKSYELVPEKTKNELPDGIKSATCYKCSFHSIKYPFCYLPYYFPQSKCAAKNKIFVEVEK